MTATRSRPALQRVTLRVFLEGEKGTRLAARSTGMMIPFGEEARTFTFPVNVPRGVRKRAAFVELQSAFNPA